MTYTLRFTFHARERMKTRGITEKRVRQTLKDHSSRTPGHTPDAMKFYGPKPPPPVVVITSWPPDKGRLDVVTCYAK